MSVKVIYVIALLDSLGRALVLPLISPHFLKLGGSLTLLGILSSFSSAGQLFGGPVLGSWSDTRGRKAVLVGSLLVVLFSDILHGVPSLPFFFLVRILDGIVHQTDPLLKALLADTIEQKDLTDKFNKLMAIAGSAYMFAPILGGILYEKFQSFFFISLLLCTIDITLLTIIHFFITDTRKIKIIKEKNSESSSIFKDLTKAFSSLTNVDWSKYGSLMFIRFVLESSSSLLFMNTTTILMRKFAFTQTQLGFAIAFIGAAFITSTFIANFMIKHVYKSDKSGIKRISHTTMALFLLFCILPFTNTATFYLTMIIPLMIGKSLQESTWMEVLSIRTTESDKGIMMGAGTSMASLAGIICPLISGITGDVFGLMALTFLPMVPALFGVLFINKSTKAM